MKRITAPLSQPMEGPDMADLHEVLTPFGWTIDPAEKTTQRCGTSIRQVVQQFRTDLNIVMKWEPADSYLQSGV